MSAGSALRLPCRRRHGNRFLLISCRRTRLLPEGGASDPLAGTGLERILAGAIEHARAAGRLTFDPPARELWHHAYIQLAHTSQAGIAGALCARAEAHTIRLALIYALADGERTINTEHLPAALALWDYAARSASWALQGATGDPLAEQIQAALRNHPGGCPAARSQTPSSTTSPPKRSSARSTRSRSPAARPAPRSPPPGVPPSSGPPHPDPTPDHPDAVTITLSTIRSRNVTIDIGPSPFEEAPGGVLISYRLHDGPITFTLTVHEARALIAEIIEQLTTPPPWSPARHRQRRLAP